MPTLFNRVLPAPPSDTFGGWENKARTTKLGIMLLAGAILLALPYVYFSAFAGIMPWDDEGALMITFRDMMEGRRLYDDAYGLYGPFYYLAVGTLFADLHVPLSHDVGRLFAATFWLACTATLAVLAFRMTRSVISSAYAFAIALILLKVFTFSPMHPEEVCLVLVLGLLHLFCSVEERATATRLATVGAIMAALLLTKINVGVIVGLPLTLVVLCATRPQSWLGALFAAIAVLGMLLPLALMLPLLQLTWVSKYWVFATVTIASAILVLARATIPGALHLRHWGASLAGSVIAATVIIGVVMRGGTTPHAILDATVFQPQNLIRNWYDETHLSRPTAASTIIAGLCALVYIVASVRPTTRDFARKVALWLKLVVTIGGILLLTYSALRGAPVGLTADRLLQVLVPFCWLFVVPREGTDSRGRPIARGAIGLVAAFMALYAFPVGGDDQLVMAILLPVALLPIHMQDAISGLDASLPKRYIGMANWHAAARGFMGIAFVTVILSATGHAAKTYADGVPLDLPGARWIRVTAETRDDLRWITEQLLHCESFFTVPGQFSLYFWTHKPTPTGINNNDVLGALTQDQQERVIGDLAAQPELCVVMAPAMQELFDRGQVAASPPLLRYIDDNFEFVAERGRNRLLKRPAGPR